MYKKIKNSSFMNLLWFLIAALPLLFFAIYSLSFFDKEKKEITYSVSNSINNLINFDDILEYEGSYSISNGIIDFNDNSYNLIAIDLSSLVNGSYRLYYTMSYDSNLPNNSVPFCSICNSSENEYFRLYSYSISDVYSYIDFDVDNGFSYLLFEFYHSYFPNGELVRCFLTNDKNYTFTQDEIRSFDSMITISYNSLDTKNIYNNFNDYLEAFNNSIFTNGFISNMFISLLNYFNVSSIYLRIFSYYLEYLILISLLHLAFDLVLLVPNICHKFMERVGGERD